MDSDRTDIAVLSDLASPAGIAGAVQSQDACKTEYNTRDKCSKCPRPLHRK